MKAVCKKLFSLMLVAILLVSAVPFQASAEEVAETAAPTVAATEPAAAPIAEIEETEAVEQQITVTTPAVNAEVVDKEIRYIEFQVTVNDNGPWRVGNLVKTKIGSTVGTPGEGTVLNVVKSITGSSAGYKLIRWELEDGTTFTNSTTINLSMAASDSYYDEKTGESYDIIAVNAIVEYVAKSINLNANGGKVSANKHTVEIGQRYDHYGKLPTPTKSGSTFLGWAKQDGNFVTNEDVVEDLSNLTAQWSTARYSVIFEAFTDPAADTADGWHDVDEFTFTGEYAINANSVLTVADGHFPTQAQIKEYFLPEEMSADGWYIDGWKIKANSATFTEGKTKVTSDIEIRPIYKKSITLYACDEGNTTRKLTVTLGSPIPTLPHPGTRDGYAFVGWYQDLAFDTLLVSKDDLANVNAHPRYYPGMGDLYAGWADATIIYLYIHTNGNTKEHTKLVRYYDAPANGFDLTDIDLYDIFPNYGKYDDKGDEKYGWYNAAQWDNYVMNRPANEFEYVDEEYLSGDDVHEFFIMLIDNGNNSSTSAANGTGYNDNSSTVDASNPSTGDDIFVAVTVMAVSACALLLFFLNKKRFAK